MHVASKPGRAWASIRESEPAALAAGVNITLYKLWAFALASFMAGVAGCLLAAQVGQPSAQSFQTQDSLTLLATTLIGGIYSLWGAVVAGVFNQLVPFVFQAQWGINPNFLLIIFGAGLLQVLLTAPGGLAQQFPKDMANLGRLILRWRASWAHAGSRHDRGRGPDRPLRRRHADRRHERRIPGRDVRPDRAERRRQDDVLQRAQRLRQACSGVDRSLRREPARDGRLPARALGPAAHVPDGEAIQQLSVYDNVAMIHEHSGAKRASRRGDVLGAIEFVGLETSPQAKVGVLGARERRLVEVARAVVGKPRVVLLDEPAAGLPDEETAPSAR